MWRCNSAGLLQLPCTHQQRKPLRYRTLLTTPPALPCAPLATLAESVHYTIHRWVFPFATLPWYKRQPGLGAF